MTAECSPLHQQPRPLTSLWRSVAIGIAIYALTSVPVAIGLVHGVTYRSDKSNVQAGDVSSFMQRLEKAMTRVDGKYYVEIATTGYTYLPGPPSTVGFFPLYPSIVATFSAVFAVKATWAAVIVSNTSLLLAMIAMHYHFSERLGEDSGSTCLWIVTAFGLYPPGFFMRMAYSESTFAVLAMLLLHSVHARWPLLQQALIIGCATAARPVGVCLVVPVFLAQSVLRIPSLRGLIRSALLLCVMTSGLILFMAFQWVALGDFIAFAHSQEHYRIRPNCEFLEWFLKTATFEPIWSLYNSDPADVRKRYCGDIPFYACLAWANPLYWMLAVGLIGVGSLMRWISSAEAWYGVAALSFCYVLKGYDAGMLSQGRYTVIVLPIFTVMGLLLSKANPFFGYPAMAACAVMSGVYASQFARGFGLL